MLLGLLLLCDYFSRIALNTLRTGQEPVLIVDPIQNTYRTFQNVMKLKCDAYDIAWVCALPIEKRVVLLDEPDDDSMMEADGQMYKVGKIGGHNVVIGCVGDMGTAASSKFITSLRNSFKSLRYILLVGIGGGAPGPENKVRLGDVVVSMPGKYTNAVWQYDLGAKTAGKRLNTFHSYTGHPDQVLKSAVSVLEEAALQSKENKQVGQELHEYVDKVNSHYPLMDQLGRPKEDLLFQPHYLHSRKGSPCNECDKGKVVSRSPREPDFPRVHPGIIATGSQVMKDAKLRDRLSAENKDLLCFEMEAAGLDCWLPSLVIRGICDYCDSHKNDDWQPYAAAVAAAYARKLLEKIPVKETDTSTSSSRAPGNNINSDTILNSSTFQGNFYGFPSK